MGSVRELGAVALLVLGCSTTATITRRNGTELEGFIQGGTPESVIVESEQGKLEEVRRDEITEIDHPGNVHALIGGLGVLWGGALILDQADVCDQTGDAADCLTPFIPVVVGASLLAWGITHWTGSKNAAGKSSMKPLHPRYGRPPPRGGTPAPGDELPPPPPAPPGVVGPAPSAPAPAAPASAAPAAPAPNPPAPTAPPAEPEPGGVVW